jgi:hypothetical protein
MNTARKITKATLHEIRWRDDGTVEDVSGGLEFTVQFNPASLKVTYTNQVQTADQANPSAQQYVGKGSSKLAIELIFDVSLPGAVEATADGETTDVRHSVEKLAKFFQPKPDDSAPADQPRYVPPGVRFKWGSFLFDGIIESLDETLDLWSEDGRPLRATVALSLSQQGIILQRGAAGGSGGTGALGGKPAGTTPMAAARAGDSIQSLSARAGLQADWKFVAQANGIENPRDIAPGTLIDVQAGVKLKAEVKASAGASGGASIRFGS